MRLRRLALGLVGMSLAMIGTPVSAQVADLHSAMLHPGDLPPGFAHVKVTVYAGFTPALHAEYVGPGPMTYDSICTAPAVLKHDGVTQMLDQTYFGKDPAQYQLCGFLFASVPGARHGYQSILRWMRRMSAADRGLHPVSTNLGATSWTITLAARQLRLDLALFQQANAVVWLSYQGPRSYPLSTFVALAEQTRERLH